MNKTKEKPKPSIGEGWAVHVYDSDRHLRFTLEPSHIWAFGSGLGVGIIVAIVLSALHSTSHRFSHNTENSTNLAPTSETEYRESLSPDPTSSFPFGID